METNFLGNQIYTAFSDSNLATWFLSINGSGKNLLRI